MTLTELIALAGGDDAIDVDRPSIRTAKRTKDGDTKVSFEVYTTAMTVDDVLAMTLGDRAGTDAKVPLLIWVPKRAWSARPQPDEPERQEQP